MAVRIDMASTAIEIFDGGRPPVAPIGTSTRLADRWLSFVRAIDSSFSAAVASVDGRSGRRHPWGVPRAQYCRAGPRSLPFLTLRCGLSVPSPIYVCRAGSDEPWPTSFRRDLRNPAGAPPANRPELRRHALETPRAKAKIRCAAEGAGAPAEPFAASVRTTGRACELT